MSLTILDRLSPEANLGTQIGKGFGSALEGLVGNKVKQLQTQAGLSALVGPKEAEQLSYLPPDLLKSAIPKLQQQQQQQLQQQRDVENWNKAYGQPNQQQQLGQQDQLIGQQQQQQFSQPNQLSGTQPNQLNDIQGQQNQFSNIQQQLAPENNVKMAGYLAGKQAMDLGLGVAEARRAADEAMNRTQKSLFEGKKESSELRKERTAADNKLIDRYGKEISDIEHSAQKAEYLQTQLDRLQELEHEIEPFAEIASKKVTFQTMSPAYQEYQQILEDLVSNAKDYWGGQKVIESEIHQYKRTLPTLNMTPNGRIRAIANMEKKIRTSLVKAKVSRDILSKNNGVPTSTFSSDLSKGLSNEMKRIVRKHKIASNRNSPYEPTMSQRIVGDVVSVLPRAGGAIVGGLKSALGKLI